MIYQNSPTHFGQWLLDPLPGCFAWDCFDYKKENIWNSLLEQNIINIHASSTKTLMAYFIFWIRRPDRWDGEAILENKSSRPLPEQASHTG